MLPGSPPPKFDRKHEPEKSWVLLTFLTCTQLIYSIQSPSHLIQPLVPPSPYLPTTTPHTPPPNDAHYGQVCQKPFDKHKIKCSLVTCVVGVVVAGREGEGFRVSGFGLRVEGLGFRVTQKA